MLRLFLLLIACLNLPVSAASLPVVKVGVLHGGTVHWELKTLQAEGLDTAHGFRLEVQPYATMSATRLALSSDGVDAIVSDWLWAGQRQAQGEALWFVPYSRAIGRVIVPENSELTWPDGLRGKRIGVAGGPYSKGWVLLQAEARQAGIDLKREAKITFAAPPLLNSELERGNLDLLVTFWHYGARLEAKGFKPLLSLQTITENQGLSAQMPMLGYLFKRNWVDQHPVLAEGFKQAVAQTKQRLQNDADDQRWTRIRPLMKATDEATFTALRSGYLQGVPTTLNDAQISSAQRFYTLIDQSRKTPTDQPLDASLFRLQP